MAVVSLLLVLWSTGLVLAGCGRPAEEAPPAAEPAAGEPAPAADARALEIVDRMIEAHGGLDGWRALRDVHFRETRVRFASEERSASTSKRDIYLKRHNGDWKVRIEVAPGGRLEQIGPDGFPAGGFIVSDPIVMGYDTRDYWEVRGGARVADPEILRSTRFIVAAWRYWFCIPFVIKDPGVNIAYGGEAELDGKPVYLIDVTFEPGVGDNPEDVFQYFINRETFMVENLRYRMGGRPRYREFRMTNYEPVGDILHDTRRNYHTHQGIHDGYKEMEILEVNSGLSDDLFRPPSSDTTEE